MNDSMVTELADVVNRMRVEIASLGGHVGFGEIESVIRASLPKIGEILLKGFTAGCDGYLGSRMPCECGGKLRFVERRELTMVTMVGSVALRRAYYHCKQCGGSRVPLDEMLGLRGGRLSDGVIDAVAYCAAHLPFEESVRMMERLTKVSVSAKEAQILSEGIGREIGKELEVQAEVANTEGLESKERPKRLYIAIDGVMIREQDGWHETKTAAVYDVKTSINRELGRQEDVADRITYVARRGSPGEFGAYVSAEAQVRGEEKAEEVIVLGDGARWIWNMASAYFPRAIEIIDWYHVSEHVWKLGRAIYDEDNSRCRDFADKHLEVLNRGAIEEVLTNLRDIVGLGEEAARERDNLVSYIETNRSRMRYDEYRAKGYHIGSGVVESACKNVVQMRHKRPGMRWSSQGAQAILNLRTAVLNDRYDEFCQRRRKARLGSQKPGIDLKAS